VITLFRRIRQKLIGSGSVTKYLMYAVGEILLVVIGILIALQVNNWNQERLLLQSAEEHLSVLESNLMDDHLKLLSLKGEIETSFRSSVNLMERYKQNLSPDIDTIMFEIAQLVFEFNFSPDKSALDILVNSGELGVLPDTLREQISQYYNSTEYIEERDEIANTFIKNQFEVIVLENYASFWTKKNSHPALAIYKDDKREVEPIDPMIVLSDKKLETKIFARYFQLERQLMAYNEGQHILEKLLHTLENR